jgi:phage repressor protein C with HTH and peptisase S24 domain
MELKDRIIAAREFADLTQVALAAKAGLSQQAIQKLEAGKSQSSRRLTEIAIACGVRPEWLSREQGLMLAAPLPSTGAPIPPPETPTGNYRVDQLDARGDMGDGHVNEDFPEIIRSVDFADSYIRSVLGFVPAPGRLKLVTGVGNSMVPVINPGEAVLIDTGCTDFQGDGIYFINSGGGQQLKGLQDRGDAIYVISANELYPPFPVKRGTIIGGRAYLLNRIERLS